MTDTINDLAAPPKQEPAGLVLDEQDVAEQILEQTRAKGIDLVGPTGLLTWLTPQVFEAALKEEDVGASAKAAGVCLSTLLAICPEATERLSSGRSPARCGSLRPCSHEGTHRTGL